MRDDHLSSAAPDEDWIALVGRKNWLAITKDRNIRYRTAELDAIRKHLARVIVIRMKNVTGPEVAEVLVKDRCRIVRFAMVTHPSFVAGIYASSTVKAFGIV